MKTRAQLVLSSALAISFLISASGEMLTTQTLQDMGLYAEYGPTFGVNGALAWKNHVNTIGDINVAADERGLGLNIWLMIGFAYSHARFIGSGGLNRAKIWSGVVACLLLLADGVLERYGFNTSTSTNAVLAVVVGLLWLGIKMGDSNEANSTRSEGFLG